MRIGVDLGGTKIAAGLTTEDGELLFKKTSPTLPERGAEAVLADIAALCGALSAENKTGEPVGSVGIGSPGLVDNKNGLFIYASNICFKNTPVRAVIGGRTGLPVFLANDADAAALGESVRGSGRGCGDSITVTLGTGIGGGTIIGGKILTGSFSGGGELGHHVIVVDGEPCPCGRNGCWEAYASASALRRDAIRLAEKRPDSRIAALAGGDLEKIEAKTVFDAAGQDDEAAKGLIDRYLTYVAEGLVNLINIFQPEIIILGGGICAQGDAILKPVLEKVSNRMYGGELRTRLKIAELGNDAGIIGAAMLYGSYTGVRKH